MSGVVAVLSFAKFSKLTGARDDHWADRLSHIYSVVLLCVLTFIVSTVQFVGDPIHCWCPAHFPNPQVAYTKSICWISNTYYVPTAEVIPREIPKREEREITYYQWVSIILLVMALMFKLPNVVWKAGSTTGGVNMDKLVEMAEEAAMTEPDKRDEVVGHLAKYLHRWLSTYRHYKRSNVCTIARKKVSGVLCFWLSKRDGSFLTGFYLFTKLLYAANVMAQFFLLNWFLAMDFTVYGFDVVKKAVQGEELSENHRFPRVTLCDFLIRQMTNVQRYTVQCVLPINLFNEKVFLLLWFWLLLVAVVCLADLAHWLYRLLPTAHRLRYVKKYLKLGGKISDPEDKRWCRHFADDYLRNDGVFVLRIVGYNSSDLVLTDVIVQLWQIYKDTYMDYELKKNKTQSLDNSHDLDHSYIPLVTVPDMTHSNGATP